MIPVPKLSKADIAFGNIKHLPEEKDIPKEFFDSNHPHNKTVTIWFFKGFSDGIHFKAKKGVDGRDAINAIQAILTSFEPSHERKMAGCAYLISEWFEKFSGSKNGNRNT